MSICIKYVHQVLPSRFFMWYYSRKSLENMISIVTWLIWGSGYRSKALRSRWRSLIAKIHFITNAEISSRTISGVRLHWPLLLPHSMFSFYFDGLWHLNTNYSFFKKIYMRCNRCFCFSYLAFLKIGRPLLEVTPHFYLKGRHLQFRE